MPGLAAPLIALALVLGARSEAWACAWPDTPETRIASSEAIVEGWVESVTPRPDDAEAGPADEEGVAGTAGLPATVPVDVAIRVVQAHKGAVPPLVVLRHRAIVGPDGALDFRTGLACTELLEDPSGKYALLVLGLHEGRYFAELLAGSAYVADDRSPELAVNRAYVRRFVPEGTTGTIVQPPEESPMKPEGLRDALLVAVPLILLAGAGVWALTRVGRPPT